MPGFLAAKNHANSAFMGSKGSGGAHVGHKNVMGYGSSRLAVVPSALGRGDAGGGHPVHGNTYNSVASGHRDSVPKDFRRSAIFDKRKPSARLESRKRNKRA